MVQLTEEQKKAISSWIEEGVKPSEIQRRLAEEFGIKLTYMEIKLLLSELNLTPKDPTPPPLQTTPQPEVKQQQSSKVRLTVDEITRPGAVISGRVKFRDGKEATWYLDRYGRLGMIPPEPGYRPSDEDIAEFQKLLEEEIGRLGF